MAKGMFFASTSVAASIAALLGAPAAGAQVVARDPVLADPAAQTSGDAGDESPDSDIVVTGSRLRTGFAAPTPVTILSGADIAERRAPTQIADVLNETPSFVPNGGASQGQFGTSAVGQATVNLRGLGNVRTLVLIDGRRPVGTQTNGTFDTNLVPSILIDRIDVVTGGASAAYGSDAVAGVVNFVLKDRLEGLQGSFSTGISQEGDGREDTAGLAYGGRFADGRLRVVLGADYARGEGVDSLYSRDWGQREPGIFTPSAPRPAGVPAQIIGDNIELRNPPGGVITAGPLTGTAFGPGGVPYTFQFGSLLGSTEQQGTSNYGYNRLGNQYIRGPFERYSGLARVSYDIGSDTTVFVEGSYGHLSPKSQTNYGNYTSLTLSTDNAFLPASVRSQLVAAGQTTFRLGRVLADLGPLQTRNQDQTYRGTLGARGKFGGGWSWDAYAEHGRSRLDFDIRDILIVPNFFNSLSAVRDASGNIVCGPVAGNANLSALQRTQVDPGCQPYNVFGPTSVSAAARDYVLGNVQGATTLTQDVGAINVQGRLFDLPGGPASIAVGYEHRRLKGVETVTPDTFAHSIIGAYAGANRLPSSGTIVVNEGYVEAELPLLRNVAFADELSFNGAARLTDYSTSGSVVTWKAGASYAPVSWLRFRATRSRDIRAPNIAELFAVAPEGFTTQTNPLTSASAQVRTQALSNPNLAPEIANTLTAGVVFQPGAIPNLRLSVDYYDIKIDDVIISVSAAEVLRRYYVLGQTAEYGQYIDFVPTAQSPTGFQKVSSPYVNANQLQTDGVDVELAYRVPTTSIGTFSLSVLGTWVSHLKTRDISGVIDSAGGTVPDLRITGDLGYANGGFKANLQARYNSGRKYSDTLFGPDEAGYNPALPTSINKNWFPSATYFTLSASYDALDEPKQRFQLFTVVNNLLDKDPPSGSYSLVSTTAGVNYYDFVGRTYRVGARFAF